MNIHKPIRLGIIGLGHVADFQLSALNHVDGFDLVAVCDKDPAKAEKVRSGVPFYENPKTLFKEIEMDAAMISVPHQGHFELAKLALKSGSDILLEKPLVSNIDELKVLSRLHDENPNSIHSALHAAFGAEVEWCLKNKQELKTLDLGQLIGFHCGFYDPYIQKGKLIESAVQLGGSWIDSAINALSVIGRFISPDKLTLTKNSKTVIADMNCREIQGLGTFSIYGDDAQIGLGLVDTNWSMGIDQKRTQLFYENGSLLLDHSKQTVVYIDSKNNNKLLAHFSDEHNRLTRHYIGVFKDFKNNHTSGVTNFTYSRKLHELMFSFYSST